MSRYEPEYSHQTLTQFRLDDHSTINKDESSTMFRTSKISSISGNQKEEINGKKKKKKNNKES